MNAPVRDAHTHFFSRTFFETLARQAPEGRPVDEALEAVGKQAGIDVPPADHALLQLRWLEQMDAHGIESMVTFASVPEELDVVAEACATSGGRLTGYVAVNAAAPAAEGLLERALGTLGLRGAVLFPALHGYAVSDPACRPALARLAAHRAVCVVHCGLLRVRLRDLFGLPRPTHAQLADPLLVAGAASAFPSVPFVIPHFGGGMLQHALLAGHGCENVYLDTSSSNDWLRAQVPRMSLRDAFERALDAVGPKRILFGTDSSAFPRGYRADLLRDQLRALDELGLGRDDRAAILGGNLARLVA